MYPLNGYIKSLSIVIIKVSDSFIWHVSNIHESWFLEFVLMCLRFRSHDSEITNQNLENQRGFAPYIRKKDVLVIMVWTIRRCMGKIKFHIWRSTFSVEFAFRTILTQWELVITRWNIKNTQGYNFIGFHMSSGDVSISHFNFHIIIGDGWIFHLISLLFIATSLIGYSYFCPIYYVHHRTHSVLQDKLTKKPSMTTCFLFFLFLPFLFLFLSPFSSQLGKSLLHCT